MANDNETVEQVLERMTRGMGRDCSVECQLLESDVVEYADRILTAHNREIDALAAQKTAEAHEAFVKNAELADAIAVKDAEIEDLKKENARLRVIVSGATVADGNLREEIGRLREIVNELVSRFDEWNTVHPQSDSVISGNLWRSLEETIIKARKECV